MTTLRSASMFDLDENAQTNVTVQNRDNLEPNTKWYGMLYFVIPKK